MKRGPKPKRPDPGYPYYALSPRAEHVPPEMWDLCKRRTGALASFDNAHRSVRDLLANAYILGLIDASDALEGRARRVGGLAGHLP